MIDDFMLNSSIAVKRSSRPSLIPFRLKGKETRFTCSQYIKLHEEMKAYFKARHESSVVIVGNGRSVLGNKGGPAIDKFTHVIRFNEFQIEGYEDHVGTRTTLWVLSDYTCAKLLNKYPERRMPVLVAIPFKMMGKPYYFERRAKLEEELTESQLRRVAFVTEKLAEQIITSYEFGQRWPSSGMIAIWHFLQEHQSVFLHGFDFFKEIDGKIHYMEDTHKANHDSKQEENICHELLHRQRVQFLI